MHTAITQRPRKEHPKRTRLTDLQRLVAAELMVHRRAPAYLVASAFGVSSTTMRKIARELQEQVA